MKLWLVGQYRSGDTLNTVWDFNGVFSLKEKALLACRNENYFIAEIELDKELPDEIGGFPKTEYPLVK